MMGFVIFVETRKYAMINASLCDEILVLEFARPEKKNAFTVAMYTELSQALEAADQNPAVKVIVLHGAGDAFSAGNDLHDFLAVDRTIEASPGIKLLRTFSRLEKPLIAAVNGIAVGIGATLLFHCDLVYAQSSARLIFHFVPLGLVPEGASSLLLPQLVGHQMASEIFFFGEPVSAQAAHTMGLVNKVLTDTPVLEFALEQAARITHMSTGSIRHTKALLKSRVAPLKSDVHDRIEAEGVIFNDRLKGPAAQEAIAAFMGKRAPNFTGMD